MAVSGELTAVALMVQPSRALSYKIFMMGTQRLFKQTINKRALRRHVRVLLSLVLWK